MSDLIASPRRFRFVQTVFRILAAPVLDWQVSGFNNIPRDGPLLVAVNHTSWLDVILPGLFFPRPLVGFGKIENFTNHPFAWLFKWMKIIPIHRGEVDRAALTQALQAIRAGAGFVIAPEGTRTPDGCLIRAKPGVALLASACQGVILPMAIVGTKRDTFERNLRSLRRTHVSIKIGEPLRLQADHADRSSRQGIADELMLYIAQLLPESQRGFYADMHFGPNRYFTSASEPDAVSSPPQNESHPLARQR